MKKGREEALSYRFSDIKVTPDKTEKEVKKEPTEKPVEYKNATFYLPVDLIAAMDQEFYRLNVDGINVDKKTFRELLLREGLARIGTIRDTLRDQHE